MGFNSGFKGLIVRPVTVSFSMQAQSKPLPCVYSVRYDNNLRWTYARPFFRHTHFSEQLSQGLWTHISTIFQLDKVTLLARSQIPKLKTYCKLKYPFTAHQWPLKDVLMARNQTLLCFCFRS